MRNQPTTPGAQLHSVSARYQSPWAERPKSAWNWYQSLVGIQTAHPTVQDEQVDDETRRAALQRLEAVLFLAREPLGSRKLSQYANLADATEARTLIRQLNARYDARGRAFRVVDVAGGYQLLTRPQFAAWLRRLEHTPGEVRLSAPALETLAVIAYRQPVGRADIEAIRGVNCGEIVRQLMDRDLVKIGGRSEELGRPYLYATTKRFLQIFGLSSLEDLPRAALVREAVIPAPAGDSESRVVSQQSSEVNDKRSEEDHDVSVKTLAALNRDEELLRGMAATLTGAPIKAEDEDDFDDDEDDLDDDDDDDLDDDEDDLDDEEDDELEDDEEDDLEEEEWEEVDDEEEDLDEEDDELDDDEEDDDWDDDDDDLDDDEEEEELDDE